MLEGYSPWQQEKLTNPTVVTIVTGCTYALVTDWLAGASIKT